MYADLLKATSAIETFNRMNLVSKKNLAAMKNAGKLAVTPEQFAALTSADIRIHKSELSELFSNMPYTPVLFPGKKHNKEKNKNVGHRRIDSLNKGAADDE